MNIYFPIWNTSPLDQFTIRNLFSIKADILGNIQLSLTNMGLYLLITTSIIFMFYLLATNYNIATPNSWSLSVESIYATVYSIVISQINANKGQMFFPLLSSLFIYILINNLVGMIPYSFAPTSHFILTFSLGFTIIGATMLSFQIRALKFLVPSGCPLGLLPLLVLIEFISYLSRNVSLGLRWGANILSGHLKYLYCVFLVKVYYNSTWLKYMTYIFNSLFIILFLYGLLEHFILFKFWLNIWKWGCSCDPNYPGPQGSGQEPQNPRPVSLSEGRGHSEEDNVPRFQGPIQRIQPQANTSGDIQDQPTVFAYLVQPEANTSGDIQDQPTVAASPVQPQADASGNTQHRSTVGASQTQPQADASGSTQNQSADAGTQTHRSHRPINYPQNYNHNQIYVYSYGRQPPVIYAQPPFSTDQIVHGPRPTNPSMPNGV